jgi:hypothetical protein
MKWMDFSDSLIVSVIYYSTYWLWYGQAHAIPNKNNKSQF